MDAVEDAQLLMALGSLVQTASGLESVLRMLFCALEDSKYGAVTAAGQSAEWLFSMNEALVARHAEIAPEPQADLKSLLSTARSLMRDRNRYVHSLWAFSSDVRLVQSRYRQHEHRSETVALRRLIDTSNALHQCKVDLVLWMVNVIGPEAMTYEFQLRDEDRHRGVPTAHPLDFL